MPRTILIVDDDREVQRYLTEAFEAQGWRVIGERDGEWAIKTFQNRRVDAVVLDILIPVVNGFQVAEAIRKHPRGEKVGIVMLTGVYRGGSHRAEAIRRYGLLDYLDKPVEASRLVDLLTEYFATVPEEATPVPPEPAPKQTPPPQPQPKEVPASRLADGAQRREKREVERAAQELVREDAALRGNLKRTPFPKLLHLLYVRRATGALFLLRENVKKIVYFKDGHPTYIKSNLLGECLGRVLVRERMITAAECEESLRRMKASKRQQGTVLIEMGVISPHNLKYALELQLQIKLFDIFTWPDGEYQFKDDAKLPNEVIALDMSNAGIILEGIRRSYDRARLENALAPYAASYLAPAPDPALRFQDLTLEDDERAFLDDIDGTRTLKEHQAASRLGEPRTSQLLYALLCAGVIEPCATQAKGQEEPGAKAAAQPKASGKAKTAEAEALPPPPVVPAPQGMAAPQAAKTQEVPGRERLAANLLSLRQKDHFGVLGLSPRAQTEDVERAYAEYAREYHPDRFRHRSEDTQVIAREIFDRLTEAYRVLVDPVTRKQYADELGKKGPTQSADAASRALAADRHFQSGEDLLRQRRFAEAAAAFAKACELVPEAGEYHALFGWATYQANPRSPDAQQEAYEALQRGVALSPRVDRTHLLLGHFLNQTGKTSLAEREFELALQCNPDCTDALRELRLISTRRTQQGPFPPSGTKSR